ncbi:uncharacterized protein LOC108596268 [Drosophila busckii]|uniref:uncharacterized protein LOC108596268 n=1 Tax=Drosophila busckii TaxID=30019 RepID=UPI00083EEC96|nr:uncharacterized protein LOC108596268 [Drosophila busckii]
MSSSNSKREAETPPLPHELTAEWTVRAQLTFAHGGEPVQREFSTQDAVQPVRVVYKWCTPSEQTEIETEQEKVARATSFRSTNSSATTYADSAFGSPQASRLATVAGAEAATAAQPPPGISAQQCGTRCRSTCNIVVSAVADFLPPHEQQQLETLNEPFVYHSKVRAQQLRDACSQTSDNEERQQQQQQQQQRRRAAAYDQRRATTEALMSFAHRRQAEQANNYAPNYSPTPTASSLKSASMSRIPSIGKTPTVPGEKKPRTVHIDVYCTGSDEEDEEEQRHADAEVSSSSDSSHDAQLYELDSNSTPQTVLDNEQMLLRHRRISGGGALPRRLAQQQQQQPMQLGHAITKCSTAEEVSESKQLLFRKHIGDQRAAKLANLRQKYMRQASDESSSAYANSTRSTMCRDATNSSISSAVHETSWKDTDEVDTAPLVTLHKSDSFEYENSLDRQRIRQMERLWSRQYSTPEQQQQHSANPQLATIAELRSARSSFQRNDTLPSESDGQSDNPLGYPARLSVQPRPGFLQFFGPPASPEPPQTAPASSAALGGDPFRRLHAAYRWKSEARDNLCVPAAAPGSSSERSSPQLNSNASTVLRCGSEAPPSTTSANTFGTVTASPLTARRFDISRDSPSEASTVASVSGYTRDHLEKARRFGSVVPMRKPGHHVGPTKNPTCQCESCQRWLAERFQLRGRAFSLGERPPLLRRPSSQT